MAQAAGADCIATACPLCQLNLDMRQKDIEAKYGRRYNLPVFYFTQLLGLAMGCSGERSVARAAWSWIRKALLECQGNSRR